MVGQLDYGQFGQGSRLPLGIDIETTGFDPHTDRITAISLYCDTWNKPFQFYDTRQWTAEDAYDTLWDIFTTHDYTLIGHNLSFDLAFIKQHWGIDYPDGSIIWDTMLAEQVLTAGYDDEKANLKDVVERYFQVVLDKSAQTSFTLVNAEGNHYEYTQEQIDYAQNDVAFLPQLAKVQADTLGVTGMATVWDIERNVLPVFAEMWRQGITVDLDRLQPLLDETEQQRDKLRIVLQDKLTEHVMWKRIEQNDAMQAELDTYLEFESAAMKTFEEQWNNHQHYQTHIDQHPDLMWEQNNWNDQKLNKKDGKPEGQRRYVRAMMKKWRETNKRPAKPKLDIGLINLDSNPQMMAAFESMGVDTPNMRGKTLARLVIDNADNEELRITLQELMAYKKAQKLLSAFGEKLIERMGPDGRLHGKFNQIGTQTGRPSCSEPNMLQMPKDKRFRACFRAAEGHVFIVSDYSQMELRIMAQLSKDKAMMKAFTEGLDLHAYTASLMFRKPIEDTGDDTRERQIAKTINFGILYGMGPNKLRETLAGDGVLVSYPEAKSFIELWKRTYHQAASTIEQLQQEAITIGYTSTPFGRRRHFHLNFEDNSQKFAAARAGANHPIQGTNADITKLAMCLIAHALGNNGTIVLQVYDEIVVEVPEQLAAWALGVVEYCMVRAAQEVLIDIPAKVDPMMSRSWSKEDRIQ